MGVLAWLAALRPKTLPAAAVPVVVGSAHMASLDLFSPVPAVAALVGALLLQVGTNLANDYYDHRKGADTPDRAGPVRATAAGLIAPHRVRNAAFATFGLATVVGLYLVAVGGWPILVVGVAGILSGIAYTAGPRPLAYVGLGDVFVFVFFGPVAVLGTVYVQAPDAFGRTAVWMPGLFLGLAVGALATAILVVNNLRDIPTDARAGKRTLAVRLGPRGSRIEYTAALTGAFLLALLAALRHGDAWLGLPLLALPLAVPPLRRVWAEHADRRALNPALGGTARVLVAYGVLGALGMVLR